MQRKQKQFFEEHEEISTNNEEMIKITDDTIFDYWYSEKRVKEIGKIKNYIDGKPYVERIVSGRKPVLSKKYNDLVLVFSGTAKTLVSVSSNNNL